MSNEAAPLKGCEESGSAECKVMLAFFANETVAVVMQLLVCIFAHSLALYTEAMTGLVDMAAYLIAFICELRKKSASDEKRELFDVIGSACSLTCLLIATMEMGKVAVRTLLAEPEAHPEERPNGELLILVTIVNMVFDGLVLWYASNALKNIKEGAGCNVSSAILHMSVDFVRCGALLINGIIIRIYPHLDVLTDASTSLILCIIIVASMVPMLQELAASTSKLATRYVVAKVQRRKTQVLGAKNGPYLFEARELSECKSKAPVAPVPRKRSEGAIPDI